jgi:serine/threonine protein kinase
MATVWRGAHRAQGTRVAVKIIRSDRGSTAAFREAFRREVRALAALHHPHVAQVFGHGELDADLTDGSGGVLPTGSPYLVMEYASGGTLMEWVARPRPWPVLRKALLALLDALAHTHARGMLHRDLKLANVLLCNDEDLAPGLRLADFGLARLPDGVEEDRVRTQGTPRYMAPEQFFGSIRCVGPWTDLYSLGCVAWHLLSGGPCTRTHRSRSWGTPT